MTTTTRERSGASTQVSELVSPARTEPHVIRDIKSQAVELARDQHAMRELQHGLQIA